MSIEQSLERIAIALEKIVELQNGENHAPKKTAGKKTSPTPEPVATTPAVEVMPAAVPAVEPAPVAAEPAAVQQSPAMPDFMGAAPATTVTCPITDQKGLLSYVMSSYQELGPEKGGRIQDILAAVGASHLNDVKPEHYATIWAGVESLKKV